jgi:FixJ family two-component response regulator
LLQADSVNLAEIGAAVTDILEAGQRAAKPFHEQELLDAIQAALQRHRIERKNRAEFYALRTRYHSLTPRESEVFPLVTCGLLNKQIAAELGASEKTIKVHRAHVMHKMNAGSLADLIRMAEKLQIGSPQV